MMETYARVSRLTLELAIEEFIDDPIEREEIEALCRDAMRIRPIPFAHAADRLRALGHHDIVNYCLSQAASR